MNQYHYVSRVIQSMTLPFTITLASSDSDYANTLIEKVVPSIQTELDRIEADYSTFKSDSLVSRFNQGDSSILLNNSQFYEIYSFLERAKLETDGYFDAYYAGYYDPTGYVKGWAIEHVFTLFLKPLLGHEQIVGVCLNGGGDMQFASQLYSDHLWTIGIEHPLNLQKIVAIYKLSDGAIATSGFSKRGHHTTQEDQTVLQTTIFSEHLGTADIWATVGLASNKKTFTSLITQQQLTGLIIYPEIVTIFSRGEMIND